MEALEETIQIRIMKVEDAENVIKFIAEYFYKSEPLCSCPPYMETADDDQEYIINCIKYELSLIAVKIDPIDSHEELIGVNLAHPKTMDDIEKYKEMDNKVDNVKWNQIMKLIAYVNEQSNIFERYAVTKSLYSLIVCVHPNYRGKSLNKLMKRKLIALGKQFGYTILTADCTSFYSARTCEQLGMECVYDLPYKDYRDIENKPIFQPSLPHERIKSYAIRI